MTKQADLEDANSIRSSTASLTLIVTTHAALETLAKNSWLPLTIKLDYLV